MYEPPGLVSTEMIFPIYFMTLPHNHSGQHMEVAIAVRQDCFFWQHCNLKASPKLAWQNISNKQQTWKLSFLNSTCKQIYKKKKTTPHIHTKKTPNKKTPIPKQPNLNSET